MPHDPIAAALARFGCVATEPPTRIGAGTLNDNYLVRTNRGAFVLRRIRIDQPDARVALEHETIRWVAAHGIPAPEPLLPIDDARIPNDELPSTCARIQSSATNGAAEVGRWVLFPFVEGGHVARGSLRTAEAAALGDMHGRLHALLRDHPRSAGASFDMHWSPEQSAALLERIETIARSEHAPTDVIDGIALQRRLLDRTDVLPPSAFADLPCQWLHGDFHVEQVLFDDDANVAAVLDWELCQSNARVWELLRSLAFSGLLDGHPDAVDYVRRYRRHVPIERDEVERGLTLWWQSRIVGVWVWWAAFIGRNERVHTLIPDVVADLRHIAESGRCERVNRLIVGAL